MGKIWIANQSFEVDARVVHWQEGPRFDARSDRCHTSPQRCDDNGQIPFGLPPGNRRKNRYMVRPLLKRYKDNPPLAAAQAVIRQFVVHHDGCMDAEMCFHVLHDERGLSCHFLLDNDGTIYQTLDLAYMAFHAAGFNSNSIGIEISSRGDAKKKPHAYPSGTRDVVTCRIHGHPYLAYDFTKPQYEAFAALTRGLQRALPNLPMEFPQSSPGQQSWDMLPDANRFSGLMGHYHTTRRKWDPGPLDFKSFLESIRGRLSFPIRVREENPDVPRDREELDKDVQKLYSVNEERGQGGFFPVGPFGESSLWHGGVHLHVPRKTPVYSPFGGRVVAARAGATSAIGSTNLVLIRHDIAFGQASIRFYSLYFHLEDESGREKDADAPRWVTSDAWKKLGKRGQVVLLDEPVEAGDLIGRAGEAGPSDQRASQFHFEIFAAREVIADIGARDWTIVDGTAGGRFADNKEILANIDIDPRDGKLSRRELVSFYTSAGRRNLSRYYGTLHVSEWVTEPNWAESLKLAPEFKDEQPKVIEELVDDQISPTLWWTDEVARHAKLPRDGVVYHYHPLTFIKTLNERLIEEEIIARTTKTGRGSVDAKDAKVSPDEIKDDFDDKEGTSFVSEDELKEVDLGEELTLEDLANGFPE